jgi:hypothetical protein
VTGDAPQPGETPRDQSERWSFADPNTAWWRVEEEREHAAALAEAAASRPRHPRRRPAPSEPANSAGSGTAPAEPAFAPEALDAHAAGAQDAAQAFDPQAPPAALVEAEQEPRIEQAEAIAAAQVRHKPEDPPAVERDHDRRPRDRYQPPDEQSKPIGGYAVSSAEDEPETEETPAEGVPDVMVLPERPVPGQPSEGRARLSQAAVQARRERMENHPFWLSEEERATAGNAWPAPEVRQRLAEQAGPADGRRGRPPLKKPRKPRGPVAGLVGLVAMALVASFFSWVSAEPFWLAVGHGDRGVATVGQCTGSGVTQRCRGSFAAADGSFAVERVTLLGVDAASRNTGALAPARMVTPDSRQAYVGRTGWMLHLRWTLGFVLVLLCGYGLAGMTGARQLETAKARRNAVLISLAGPVLLLIGFLAAAY